LPRLGIACRPFGNQDILAIALVFWRHQPQATFLQKTTNDRLLRTLQNFNHTTFWPPLAIKAHHTHLDPILVQNSTHFIGRQKDVRLTVIANQKAVAIAMALHAAFNFFQHPAGWSHFFNIQSLDS